MPMSKTKELFCTFFKIGAFTFGGGYAMVALLEHEFVEEKRRPCGGEQRHLHRL